MKVEAVELIRIGIPLKTPFRTSFGTETERDVLLVHVITQDAEGWGECVAASSPSYSSEFVDGAQDVITRFLLPRLRDAPEIYADGFASLVASVKGHRMAKGALEMALLDAELRSAGVSLAKRLGAVQDTVPAGVSVGIMDTIPELVDAVSGYLAEGYLRIKLKIEPGWDLEPVRAVREASPDALLQVDANTAYTVSDAEHLAGLDAFDLVLIEQPLAEGDLSGHAFLAKRVQTPICLDESIDSARAAVQAIEMGACSIVNIKAGRVGGYLEAVRVHDVCLGHGIPVWCGGMLETGIGRAANVALAALPGFSLPGDTSASDRYYSQDITEPFVLVDGHIQVPKGPGLGVTPSPEILTRLTNSRELMRF
jgi:o-succinylbenzoate synthase